MAAIESLAVEVKYAKILKALREKELAELNTLSFELLLLGAMCNVYTKVFAYECLEFAANPAEHFVTKAVMDVASSTCNRAYSLIAPQAALIAQHLARRRQMQQARKAASNKAKAPEEEVRTMTKMEMLQQEMALLQKQLEEMKRLNDGGVPSAAHEEGGADAGPSLAAPALMKASEPAAPAPAVKKLPFLDGIKAAARNRRVNDERLTPERKVAKPGAEAAAAAAGGAGGKADLQSTLRSAFQQRFHTMTPVGKGAAAPTVVSPAGSDGSGAFDSPGPADAANRPAVTQLDRKASILRRRSSLKQMPLATALDDAGSVASSTATTDASANFLGTRIDVNARNRRRSGAMNPQAMKDAREDRKRRVSAMHDKMSASGKSMDSDGSGFVDAGADVDEDDAAAVLVEEEAPARTPQLKRGVSFSHTVSVKEYTPLSASKADTPTTPPRPMPSSSVLTSPLRSPLAVASSASKPSPARAPAPPPPPPASQAPSGGTGTPLRSGPPRPAGLAPPPPRPAAPPAAPPSSCSSSSSTGGKTGGTPNRPGLLSEIQNFSASKQLRRASVASEDGGSDVENSSVRSYSSASTTRGGRSDFLKEIESGASKLRKVPPKGASTSEEGRAPLQPARPTNATPGRGLPFDPAVQLTLLKKTDKSKVI